MEVSQNQNIFYGENVTIEKINDNCIIYKLRDKNSYGTMTSYKVFNGINLIYNNINMKYINTVDNLPKGFYEINHCKEGRIECEFEKGECLYMGKDDFVINKKENSSHESYFPLGHFYGISISLDVNEADKEIKKYLPNSNINLKRMLEEICSDKEFFIMKANKSIGHIFAELYSVPEEIKMDYFKIKVLEIILFSSTLNRNNEENRVYFSRECVEKIKDIEKLITSNYNKRFTLVELSNIYNISLTTMKNCFKGVYGTSIYSYLRNYKMKIAAKELINTNKNILEIANFVGYENGSKFAKAFKDIVGVSPMNFRKKSKVNNCLNGAK